jgi:ABC-2 type transport system ATP-binding protein
MPIDEKEGSPIRVRGLRKNYGDLAAVRGVDFEVRSGEVFGLLGPNGAGKTTTVEILEGLRPRTGGDVTVLGFDPEYQSKALKDRIGVCLQSTNLPDKIKVKESVDLFSDLYSRSVGRDGLLKQLQLWDKRNSHYAQLSGGQKQRLAIALALINDPQVVFLDEPTSGLDPQARHEIHNLVQDLRQNERTILLTTHYIEEAERLCDRVAIIDEGRIIAMGTPQEIRNKTVGQSIIEIHSEQPMPQESSVSWNGTEKYHFGPGRTSLVVHSAHPARTLVDLVKWLDQNGIELSDVHLKRPSLEDVYIEMTGRSLRD